VYEYLGVQIEEPFSILPLANICNEIQYSGQQLLEDHELPWFQIDKKDETVDKKPKGEQ
jgi:predicted membrane chloride channel (bestrophin family)